MNYQDFHSFPRSVEAFADSGIVSRLRGGDGIYRKQLEIPGSYRGRNGNFEFIREPDGEIKHRLFKPFEEK